MNVLINAKKDILKLSYTNKDGVFQEFFGIKFEGNDVPLLHKKVQGTDTRMNFKEMHAFLKEDETWVDRCSYVADGEHGAYFSISMTKSEHFTL